MATKRVASRGSDQFMLRFPPGMRETIARLAAKNGRSMNSEILARLESTFEADDTLDRLWTKVEDLERMVYAIDQELHPMDYDHD